MRLKSSIDETHVSITLLFHFLIAMTSSAQRGQRKASAFKDFYIAAEATCRAPELERTSALAIKGLPPLMAIIQSTARSEHESK